MAVELTHRIVIEGPKGAVTRFRRDLARPGVPFSFDALWEKARYPGDPPMDPYNLARFPIIEFGRAQAEIRYTFLTRNLEMDALLLGLLRSYPKLTCRLATIADDGDVWVFLIRRGRRRRRDAPEWLTDYHYERVAWENGMTRDQLQEEGLFDWDADWAILDDSINLFNDVAPRNKRPLKESWYGRRVRLLDDEWEKQVRALLAAQDAEDE